MKTQVKALVIGGGAVGTSIAYHLARAGGDEVMLLERYELTSGSTWHAAGLLPYFNMSFATTHIHDYSIRFYKTLEEETGLNAGFAVVGNLRMAQTQERMDEYMLYASTAETVGVPFEWLTSFQLTRKQWAKLADRMGWQALRMNLNTLARHDAFGVKGVTQQVANRLGDPDAFKRVKPAPYQLMTALTQVGEGVPLEVQAALEKALETSVSKVPKLKGNVVVCPDVSGSMQSPATGYRPGATSVVRCVDIAALVAAANRIAK